MDDLWAIARIDMRLTDEGFGVLTLDRFAMLQKRLDARNEHDYFCAGIVAATYANAHCDRDKRPEGFSPLDFIPGYKPEERQGRVLTPEEQVAAFEALFNPPQSEIIRM